MSINMSLVIKTEPTSDVSSDSDIVELSSEEELSNMLSPKRNGAPSYISPHARPRTPETHCSICLEELTNRCYTNMCVHMFCFECLKRWASIDSSCPLCKKRFHSIKHSLSEYGHEVYEVPIQEQRTINPTVLNPLPRIFLRQAEQIYEPMFLSRILIPAEWRNNRNIIEDLRLNNSFTLESIPLDPRLWGDAPSIGRRIEVYRLNIWATPLPDLSGRFRECRSTYFRENPAQVHRLHSFIVRDVAAIASFDNMRINSNINELHILRLITQSILTYEITDTFTINMLRPYLGTYASHFCHELYNFANSPYDMLGYDRNVRYRHQRSVHQDFNNRTEQFQQSMDQLIDAPHAFQPLPETIDLDSDDSAIELVANIHTNEIITIDTTSGNDSDVEIIDSFTLPNPSRDLPSTSTGIRDSLDCPNNRYNLRRRRLSSPNLNVNDSPISAPIIRPRLPRRVTRRIIVDTSSSDEDVEDFIVSVKTESGIARRRKRKIRKTKPRKKRIVEDSKTENRNRSRSYSESSSSSCDTDLRPNNNCIRIN